MAWAGAAQELEKRGKSNLGDTKQNEFASSDLAHWYQRVQRDVEPREHLSDLRKNEPRCTQRDAAELNISFM